MIKHQEDYEERFYERIETKLPKRDLINLRNKYDQGWNNMVKGSVKPK